MHVGGLLLGQAQHLAGLAAEPGVGRVLVLVDLGAQRLDLGLRATSAGLWASVRLAARPAFSAVDGAQVACRRRRCRSRRDARSAATAAGRLAAERRRRAAGGAAGRLAARRLGALAAEPAGAARWLLARPAAAGSARLGSARAVSATFWAVFCPAAAGALGRALSPGDHLGGLVPGVLGLVVEDGQALVAHESSSSPGSASPTYAASVTHGRGVSHRDPCDAPRALKKVTPGGTSAWCHRVWWDGCDG